MPTVTEPTPGVFSWVDLMSPDVDASKEFYSSVLGWDMEDQRDDEGNRVYVMCSLRGHSVAGIGGQMPGTEGMPPMWNSYVATDDIRATTAKVEPAGGSVLVEPMEIFTSGHMAVYAAPDGALVSAWQAGDHIGAELVDEDGAWSWNELMTRAVDVARPFYAEVFGWEYDSQDIGPMGTYWLPRVGDRQLAGMMTMPPGAPAAAPNHWGVYFTTSDLDAALTRVTEHDGTVAIDPHTMQGVGRMAMVHDPQGGSFSLLEPEATDG